MEEFKRALAHVEKIVDIRPIEGADNIQQCTILGWNCVIAKKDNFNVGDLVVYIEVDSVVPDRPEFEFLRERKFRVRTIKLRKTISQGLVLPLSMVSSLTASRGYKPVVEGEDVTEYLGITHFDPESSLHRKAEEEYKPQSRFLKFLLKYRIFRKIILPFIIKKPKGVWPEFIAKTDEPRLQNIPRTLEIYKDKEFFVTEKIDYQSVTFFLRKMKVGIREKLVFGVCSRNQWLKTEDNSLYWKIAKKYDIERILREEYEATGLTLTIQGEQGDISVQKNKYGIKEPRLWVFNIIDNKNDKHFDLSDMQYFCEETGLEFVPVLDKSFKLKSTVAEMVEYSKGKSVINSNTIREGIVVRNIEDGKKISFKIINPEFDLKHNKED